MTDRKPFTKAVQKKHALKKLAETIKSLEPKKGMVKLSFDFGLELEVPQSSVSIQTQTDCISPGIAIVRRKIVRRNYLVVSNVCVTEAVYGQLRAVMLSATMPRYDSGFLESYQNWVQVEAESFSGSYRGYLTRLDTFYDDGLEHCSLRMSFELEITESIFDFTLKV
jgi:hypothetical protein